MKIPYNSDVRRWRADSYDDDVHALEFNSKTKPYFVGFQFARMFIKKEYI